MKYHSFYVSYWSTDGKCLIGGVLKFESSRFHRRSDAECHLQTVKALNGPHCDGKIVPSASLPEIFAHCGSFATSIGSICSECKTRLTTEHARALPEVQP